MTDNARAPRRTKRLPAAVIALIAIVLLCIVVWRKDHAPSTDDAYVYADTINVVPEVSGRIVDLSVRDNQAVRKGDLLFRIDPRPYQAALDQARARLVAHDKQIGLTERSVNAQQYNAESVKAAVERARAVAAQAADTLHRTEPLLDHGYVSAEEVDRARTAQRSAQAELDAATLQAQQASAAVSGVDALVAQRAEVEAQIAIAELNVEFTEVRAPFDGRVVSLRTTVGQYASPLKPIFTLIDTDHWYVVANFRETDLKNVRAGTPANVYLMSDTSKRFSGVVDSVSYGVLPDDGGLVLEGLPRVQRSINWVHVSQRFPVKIAVRNPDPALFRLGTSAVATLDPTGTTAGAAQ
ncbi:multidrug transporter subunit MdtN [Paraburkholderia sp. BR14262]|uniref:multidrug transporter subunit MdtN n=1 Tax=Paraburkholderia sp. BR14262 TaxID=3236999 RepID=UPI0034CEF90D